MGSDGGPWSRLLEEHRQNVERLEVDRPAPPPGWGLPLGMAAPWLCFWMALAWREGVVAITAVLCFAMLVPIGLVCFFIGRLQTVAVGIVLGMLGTLFATAVVLS